MFGTEVVCPVTVKNNEIGWLEPIMLQWAVYIKEYCRAIEGDVPYDYTERALVGILSAAAWVKGHASIEEYQVMKEGNVGRADLFIMSIGNMSSVSVEAKKGRIQAWKDGCSIDESLDRANEDAQKVDDGDVSVGAAFYLVSCDKDGYDLKIILAKLKAMTPGVHLLAWCFPKERRRFSREETPDDFLPGVVLAVRVAKQLKRS